MIQKKYSLALGGGASRGFAHIGVFKYLEEKNIQIEELSGTSMGAIIASLIAIGKNSSEILEIAKSINFLKLIDLDLSFGVLKGKKILKKLEDIFGTTKIEDLKIPLKIVATNIETGERKVFTKGKISEALRASLSLPGVFIPYKIGKFCYVDGGIVNNLPVDVLNGKNIIGVSALKNIKGPLIFKKDFLGFKININFFKYNYQVLHRVILFMMSQNEDKSIKSLNGKGIIIKPKFGDLDYYDYDKIDEFVELGYKEAKIKLGKI